MKTKLILFFVFSLSLCYAQNDNINQFLNKNSEAYGMALSMVDVGQMMGETFLFDEFRYWNTKTNDKVLLYGSFLPQMKGKYYEVSIFIKVDKNLSVGFCCRIHSDSNTAEVAILKKTGGDNYECNYIRAEKVRIPSEDNEYLEAIDFPDHSRVIIKDKYWVDCFNSQCIDKKGLFIFKRGYHFTEEK